MEKRIGKNIFCIKFTDKNQTCRDFRFHSTRWSSIDEKHTIAVCDTGFHGSPVEIGSLKRWCTNRFEMYICELYDEDGIIEHKSESSPKKYCARHIRLVSEINLSELLGKNWSQIVKYLKTQIAYCIKNRKKGVYPNLPKK